MTARDRAERALRRWEDKHRCTVGCQLCPNVGGAERDRLVEAVTAELELYTHEVQDVLAKQARGGFSC